MLTSLFFYLKKGDITKSISHEKNHWHITIRSLYRILWQCAKYSGYIYQQSQCRQGWTNIDANNDGYMWINCNTLLSTCYCHSSKSCLFPQSYDNHGKAANANSYNLYRRGKDKQ